MPGKKGGGGCHGMGGCNLSFAKDFDFSQFSQRVFCGVAGQEGFIVPPQSITFVLCCHKAAGLFCGATEQQGFLCCHGAVWFLSFCFVLPPGSRVM